MNKITNHQVTNCFLSNVIVFFFCYYIKDVVSSPSHGSMSYSAAILNTVNSTTSSLYQEYNKYVSYISNEITSRLNTSPVSSAPTGAASPVTTPTPKRLDLHEIIKPFIDLTGTSGTTPEATKSAKNAVPPAVSIIRIQTEQKLSNEARLVVLSESLQRASSLLIKSELIADLYKLLYASPEIRFAVHKRSLPLVKQLLDLKALNSR